MKSLKIIIVLTSDLNEGQTDESQPADDIEYGSDQRQVIVLRTDSIELLQVQLIQINDGCIIMSMNVGCVCVCVCVRERDVMKVAYFNSLLCVCVRERER